LESILPALKTTKNEPATKFTGVEGLNKDDLKRKKGRNPQSHALPDRKQLEVVPYQLRQPTREYATSTGVDSSSTANPTADPTLITCKEEEENNFAEENRRRLVPRLQLEAPSGVAIPGSVSSLGPF